MMNHLPMFPLYGFRKFILLLVICPGLLLSTTSRGLAAGTLRYAYLVAQGATQVALNSIDPGSGQTSVDVINVTVPSGYGLWRANASPDGRWIVMVFAREVGSLIQLVDVTTGQVREVAGLDLAVLPIWSPDSRYMAFNGRLHTSEPYDGPVGQIVPALAGKLQTPSGTRNTYIYSLDTHTLKTIKNGSDKPVDAIYPYRLAWSSDSALLAIASTTCINQLCETLFETFNVVTTARASSTQFPVHISNVSICQFVWAPNSPYLAFVASCDDLGEYFREVFVWDTNQNRIIQLTAYTNPFPPPDPGWSQEFTTDYEISWYDAQTLLVGYYTARSQLGVGVDAGTLAMQTAAYQLPHATKIPLLTQAGLEWALNPVSHEVAFRGVTMGVDASNSLTTSSASIQVGAFNGRNLTVARQGPAGCNLIWSPDGVILAYSGRGTPPKACNEGDPIRSFTFINKNTGSVKTLPLAVASSPVLVGWVLIPV